MDDSMSLKNAINLVRSGGRCSLEHGKLLLTERRGVLFLSIDDQETVVAEQTLWDLYWREQWLAV